MRGACRVFPLVLVLLTIVRLPGVAQIRPLPWRPLPASSVPEKRDITAA